MKLITVGYAGSLESGDVYAVTKPNPGKGIKIEIESIVKMQFGDDILNTVNNVLESLGVTDAIVEINDKGALDSVIKSRVQASLYRSAEVTEVEWGRYQHE